MNRADLQLGAAYTVGKATDFSSSFSAGRAARRLWSARSREGSGRLRRPAQAGALGELEDAGAADRRAAGDRGRLAGGRRVDRAERHAVHRVLLGPRVRRRSGTPAGDIVGNSGCDYNADDAGNDRPNVPSFGDSKSGLSNDDFLTGIFVAADFPTPRRACRAASAGTPSRGPRLLQRRSRPGEIDPRAVDDRRGRRSAVPSRDVQRAEHDEPVQPGQQHDRRDVRPIDTALPGGSCSFDAVLLLRRRQSVRGESPPAPAAPRDVRAISSSAMRHAFNRRADRDRAGAAPCRCWCRRCLVLRQRAPAPRPWQRLRHARTSAPSRRCSSSDSRPPIAHARAVAARDASRS